jgi:Polyketide cyclase / dehydrase and lipid transport
MASLNFEQHIAASPALVSAFFVPQRMPYWYGAEMNCELEVLGGAADFAVGQKIRIAGKVGAREISLTAVVTKCDFGRVLEWKFQDSYGVKGEQAWIIEAEGDGATVRMRDVYEMPGAFGRAFDWLFTRHAVARRDRDWLARLRRLAERR